MEQTSSSNMATVEWLADYTHFICDKFSLPHDQAGGLLQEYLDLTARRPPQEPARSSYEHQSCYPETASPNQYVNPQEQSPSSNLATDVQDLPLSYPDPSNLHYEASFGKDARHLSGSMTNPEPAPERLSSPYDEQSHWMNIDPDLPEASSSPAQPSKPSDQNTIGSVADYDPLWVQRNNVDPKKVEGCQSQMKFDTLFCHKVIRVGDVFTFQVCVSDNGQDKETEAHLQIVGSSKSNSQTCPLQRPDLSVLLLSDPSRQYPIAKTCRGTNDMIAHLKNACNMTVLNMSPQGIQVFRGQQALGSIWWVKKAFHLWRDLKDKEAQQAGQFFRTRRPQRVRSSNVVHHKGRIGVWQGENFVLDPDQDQYRPMG